MKRIKKIFKLVHLVLWLILIFLVVFQLQKEDSSNWLAPSLAFILSGLYVFYAHFFLLTLYLGKRKKIAYFFRLAAVVLSGPFVFVLCHYQKFNAWYPAFEYYAMALLSIVPIFLFLSWLARVTENLVLNTFKKELLEKQAVEAELQNLKSQINPHFLFNTLHNIHTLVYKQASTAPEAVLRLASLMRYMIYESNAALVPLSREINYLRDYISLQQLRYKKFPVVDMEVQGAIDSYYIAPLLFVHLLENAYKHSPARLAPGEVKVTLQVIGDTLTFKVSNPIEKKVSTALEDAGGIGLPNVRKRLALLYPNQHSFETIEIEGTFEVQLNIQGLNLQVHEKKTDLLYH